MSEKKNHPQTIDAAARLLRAGEVCAFATETVYGLGADAANADAVLKIYETKQRPRFNPLIVHCMNIEQAQELVDMPALAVKVANIFWPGPLTLVLPKKRGAHVCDLVSAGLETLAVRVPAHEQAQALIKAVGRPLAAPSANPSGRLSATTARQVRELFNDRVPVLDGGACANGLESTIIAFSRERAVQLRAGALARDEIAKKTGLFVELADATSPVRAPGMLKSHYAPKARLRLDAQSREEGEAFLAFGPGMQEGQEVLNLSPGGDLSEAARNLFSMLHRLDGLAYRTIAVAPIPDHGLGEAINDRLRRAAAPRGE